MITSNSDKKDSNKESSGRSLLSRNSRSYSASVTSDVSIIENLNDQIKKYTPRSTYAVSYNLFEPLLIALSIGISLQLANCITMIYVVIDICAITPMILSTKFEVIKAKLVMTWVKLGIAFISIILKIVATFFYNKNPDGTLITSAKFLGFYVKSGENGGPE